LIETTTIVSPDVLAMNGILVYKREKRDDIIIEILTFVSNHY